MTDPDLHRRGGSATYSEDEHGNRTLLSYTPAHPGEDPVEPAVKTPVEPAIEAAPKTKEPRK